MGADSVGLGFGTQTAQNSLQSALAGAGATRALGKKMPPQNPPQKKPVGGIGAAQEGEQK